MFINKCLLAGVIVQILMPVRPLGFEATLENAALPLNFGLHAAHFLFRALMLTFSKKDWNSWGSVLSFTL